MKNNYMKNINQDLKEYFNILEPDFPTWLNDYINTKEMLKQQYISITCGTIYSDLFESEFFFSSLDHAIAVALIIWHFTKDKIQLKEVDNYHLYPIADNDTPQLSSDRLEYSLSNALFTYKLSDIEIIREIYNDIKIVKNEHNIDEMAFKSKKIAREFVKITSDYQ